MGVRGDIIPRIVSFMSLQLDVCTDSPGCPLRRRLSAGLQAIGFGREVWRTEHPYPAEIRRKSRCLVTTPTELTFAQCPNNPITKFSNNMNVICYFGLPRNVKVRTYLLTKILGTEYS